jgi:Flp pilus assembly protein TadG
MSARLREERGQAVLVTVLFLAVLLGAVALTIDVGAWYREQRQAQATADAAALAGAQALPTDPARAMTLAAHYASVNGGGVPVSGISIATGIRTNDTVKVDVARTSPGFFAKIFSLDSVTVRSTAAARAGVPQEAKYVAPIVVNKLQPDLSGPGCPCFNQETTLPLGKDGAPGAFGLIDLDGTHNGTVGASTLADWIANGFDDYLALGKYNSDPGAKFNSSEVAAALQARTGTELLFPVYDTLTGGGSNAQYNIIGWVAFHLDCFGDVDAHGVCTSNHGNSQDITGYFTRVIWDGIQSTKNLNLPDFGTYSVSLIN